MSYPTLAFENGLISTEDVLVRALTAHKINGEVCRGRPLLCRPKTKDALGIMAALRMKDWCLDLVCVETYEKSCLVLITPACSEPINLTVSPNYNVYVGIIKQDVQGRLSVWS